MTVSPLTNQTSAVRGPPSNDAKDADDAEDATEDTGIELLARANTHGKKFFAMGGSHVCSDDFFKVQALLVRCKPGWGKNVLNITF